MDKNGLKRLETAVFEHFRAISRRLGAVRRWLQSLELFKSMPERSLEPSPTTHTQLLQKKPWIVGLSLFEDLQALGIRAVSRCFKRFPRDFLGIFMSCHVFLHVFHDF